MLPRMLAIVLALSATGISPASAQSALAPAPREGWEFTITPYVWLAGISGDLTTPFNRASRLEVSADFGELLSDMSGFAFMGSAEARYGRLIVLGDFLALTITNDVSTRDILFQGGKARVQTTGTGLAALYRVVEDPRGVLDLGVGMRPWWVDTRLTLNSGLATGGTAKASESWIDPVIAIRGSIRLSPSWAISGYADIGGFGVGSELTWQAVATLDWRANEWLTLRAGWRHLSFDFQNHSLSLNADITGPIIGAAFRF